MPQTSVEINAKAGAPGQPFNSFHRCVTRIASVDIPFGARVVFDDEFCSLATTANGVTGREGGVARANALCASGDGHKAGDVVAVIVEGLVWVNHEQTATAMDLVYARYSNPSGGVNGDFRGSPTFSAIVPNARVAKNNGGAGPTFPTLIHLYDSPPTGAVGP